MADLGTRQSIGLRPVALAETNNNNTDTNKISLMINSKDTKLRQVYSPTNVKSKSIDQSLFMSSILTDDI